jgi:Holliday junction resolvase RusA-like endonuclease
MRLVGTERLLAILEAMGADWQSVQVVSLEGEPHSKERARHARQGRFTKTFQTPEDRAAERRTAAVFRRNVVPFAGNVAVAAIFYRSDRRTVDSDNLMKHVCDSANKLVFPDDSYVTAQAGIIELDAQYPRTLIAFAPHRSTMQRGDDYRAHCPACGEWFLLEGKSAATKFCSQACSAKGRRKDFIPLEATA